MLKEPSLHLAVAPAGAPGVLMVGMVEAVLVDVPLGARAVFTVLAAGAALAAGAMATVLEAGAGLAAAVLTAGAAGHLAILPAASRH